jgi:hypothetical protein
MGYIEQTKVLAEYLNFLRNSDILTTTVRGVTTTSDTKTTAATGAETFTLTHLGVKNIRSITYDGSTIYNVKDYTINLDSNQVTLLSVVPGKTVVISYDYGTGDRIYPDYPRCFTESAEALTISGFKKIKDLKIGEFILTYNLEKQTYEYQPVLEFISQEYTGEMVRIQNQQIDTLVTPNHKFVIRDSNCFWSKKPFLREAKDLSSANKILHVAKWIGEDSIQIELAEEKKKYSPQKFKHYIKIEDYLALLGIYLSKGSVNKNNYVVISQTKPETKKEIEILLNKIGLKYGYSRGSFYIYDYRLGNIFKQYGKNCYSKFIPAEIKQMSSEKLQILLDWLIKGDGTPIDKSEDSWEYYTTSKKLSDDVQEIALKCGRPVKYRIKRAKLSTCDCYAIKIYSKRYSNSKVKIGDKTTELFSGLVYCVTTPNHTLVVRDNKKIYISGNSDISISKFPRIGFGIYGFRSEVAGFGNVLKSTWRFDVRVYATSQKQADELTDSIRSKNIAAYVSLNYCNRIYPEATRDLGLMELEKGKDKIYVKGLDIIVINEYEIN